MNLNEMDAEEGGDGAEQKFKIPVFMVIKF